MALGHQVTVIGRNANNLASLTAKGAKAAVGTVEDEAFLQDVFAGADAVYTMVPPQYSAQSLDAYQRIGATYAEAVKGNNIKYVVNLSSIGAHMREG